jgi:hypothetical protein
MRNALHVTEWREHWTDKICLDMLVDGDVALCAMPTRGLRRALCWLNLIMDQAMEVSYVGYPEFDYYRPIKDELNRRGWV